MTEFQSIGNQQLLVTKYLVQEIQSIVKNQFQILQQSKQINKSVTDKQI